MKVVVLIATTTVVLGAGVVFAETFLGPGHLIPAGVAATLCLLPGVGTLVLADLVARRAPEFGPAAVLAGTGLRMGVVLIGTVLLGEVLARFGVLRDRFAGWVVFLYLVTLAVECGLLIRSAAGPQAGGGGAARAAEGAR